MNDRDQTRERLEDHAERLDSMSKDNTAKHIWIEPSLAGAIAKDIREHLQQTDKTATAFSVMWQHLSYKQKHEFWWKINTRLMES